jgi:hypothetical protein
MAVALIRTRAFRNAYFFRGLLVWIAGRLAMAYGGVWNPNLVEEALLLALAAVAIALDARRRREDLFLGNLGVSTSDIALHALPLALIAELLVP